MSVCPNDVDASVILRELDSMENHRLRCYLLALMGLPALGSALLQAQTRQYPMLSAEPLTTDQVAIYRAVISDHLKGSSERLNIASTTESADRSGSFFDYRCMKDAESKGSSPPVIHKLESLVTGNPHLVLVESGRQQEQIEKNDTQHLLQKAIDDHEKVTDRVLDQSVIEAFNTGLFTLSEIVFDKQHLHAVVAYSFVCGGLCGNGNTLLLKKVGRKWVIRKRCGGWVS